MHSFNVFVGANNRTKRVDRDKINKILNKYHEGYTITQARGFWRGESEPSVMIFIQDDRDKVMNTINDLKTELEQESVAYQELPELRFV